MNHQEANPWGPELAPAPGMNDANFSTSEALRFGWETFKRNLGPATVLTVVSLIAAVLLDGVVEATPHPGALAFGFSLLSQLVHAFLSFVWIRFVLAIYDGRPLSTRELLPSGLMLVNYLAVSILYGLLVTAGLILLIVPGIYLAVRYGLVGFLVADGRYDLIGVFHESSALTRGVRGKLFLFMLAVFLLNLAGAIAFGIGLLVTLPMSAFAAALVYRRLAERASPERIVVGPPSAMPA